ncbi:hypothetical protein ATO6_10635 [Oceanicola sp. 22II-s10i]|uniref:substrate-binding domain-containing protein n=1 Tax=Oceanicola sp. 22II-s10i TaxID=1317116 RepID=UPI000B526DB8|nr:substrate-binding domain-containing protein [Oceanicola sp. 22II-s10i]OWU84772.1 hypothetical protein ATO6_10635 [Oceanicola sp. 22II-s10i]
MPTTLRIFVPTAIRAFMDRIAPRLEAETGVRLVQLVDLNPVIPERIRAGEPYDIGLTNPDYAQALIDDGFAVRDSHRAFGRVSLAIARKGGSDGPVLAEQDDIEALLRGAKSIAYTGAGTSGRTYLDAMARLGLSDVVVPKSHALEGGVPAASVADGTYELAIAPLTTVVATPGVVAAAVFPDHLGTHIDMSAFRGTTSSAAAKRVVDVLTDPNLDDDCAAAGISRFHLI